MDITRFLACEHESREYLQRPFRMPGGLAASNSHVLIIVQDHELLETTGSAPEKTVSKALEYLALPRTAQPIPASCIELGEATPCPQCDGSGTMFERTCSQCNGQCLTESNGGLIGACTACNGFGLELCKTNEAGATRLSCPTCEGHKEDYQTRLVQGIPFQRKYLALLATLPDCQLQVGGFQEPARFTFTGGYGLLMPCWPENDSGSPYLQ